MEGIMESDSEMNNLLKVCITIVTSLTFCYLVARKIPEGKTRLIALIPIISLFTLLPWKLSSLHFGSIIFLTITGLANVKLILFAFNKGPLASDPSISLLRFIAIACLPIEIKHGHNTTMKQGLKSPLNYSIKVLVLASACSMYVVFKNYVGKYLIVVFYWCYIYLVLELIFSSLAATARVMLEFEIEQQFDEPYLSTSVQNFWGKRWNIMVSNILRSSLYNPIRNIFSPILGRRWALILAVMITFVVSGLMHELFYFYVTRVEPTWEVTCYFIVQGVCIVLEIETKKSLAGRWQLHPAISRPLAVGFVLITSSWLMFPQLSRNAVDVKVAGEYASFIKFANDQVLNLCNPYLQSLHLNLGTSTPQPKFN